MSFPTVTIGMPVFNDKPFLSKSLNSVLAQTFTDFELLISDDGSTDGSEAVCREYAARDSRIRYIRQPVNLGVSRNMEYLLQQATGKYFMWAGSDDILDSSFISTLKQLLDTDDAAVMAFCPTTFIDEDDRILQTVRTDYSGKTAVKRIKKLIHEFEDSCGYGLFVREKMKEVQFPVWWAVNKTRAYNNIYPTICYYLAKGNYLLSTGNALFYKRIKTNYVNHRVPFTGTYIKGFFAFVLWKFNLVWFSEKQIYRAGKSPLLAIQVLPLMFFKWFLIPTAKDTGSRLYTFWEQKIKSRSASRLNR